MLETRSAQPLRLRARAGTHLREPRREPLCGTLACYAGEVAALLLPSRTLLALALYLGAVLGCAALSAEPGARARATRAVGLLALVSGLALPPSWGLARVFAAGFGPLAFGRAVDLARRPGGLSFAARAWFMVAMFDLRELQRQPARADLREALWFGGHLALFASCWHLIYLRPASLSLPVETGIRWACGLALLYGLAELIQSSQLLVYRALGFELPRINDYPLRSLSLSEFWGRRWNRVVSGWLNENLFRPLARRRKPKLGLAAAFGASAALHFWLAWLPLDLRAGLTMACFFLVQGLALLAERKLRQPRWPRPARRLWTAACIAAPSPLFIEPALAMLDLFNPPLRALTGI